MQIYILYETERVVLKKIIGLLLFAVVTVAVFSVSVSAAGTATDSYGIVYSLQSDSSYAYVSDASAASGAVTVASQVNIDGSSYTVNAIGVNAFKYSNVSSVVLPATLVTIADEAFVWSSKLESVDLGGAAVSIGNKAFENCTLLSDVKNSDSVTYVGAGAFSDTPWFLSLTDTKLYIGKCLVRYTGTADSLVFAPSVVSVAPYAFADNTTVKNVDFTNVTKIGANAFYGHKALESADLSGVTYVGDSAFYGCSKLSGNVSFDNVSYFGSDAFRNTSITSADLSGASIEYLPDGAFNGCSKLTSVKLSQNIKTVGNHAFYGCSALGEVVCPGVVTIGYDAFRNCALLEDKACFANVTSISTGAFDGTTIYSSAGGALCTVGKTAYKTEQTAADAIAVEKNTVTVSPYAFYKLTSAKYISLPDTLESIGENVFYSLSDTNTKILAFSQKDSLYSDLQNVPCGTVYVPQGKTLENDNVTVGEITGISVVQLPSKTEYTLTGKLDTTGISVVVNTVVGDTARSFDVSQLGYECNYTYDFSVSGTVTVELFGYTASFEVSINDDVLAGDVNSDGKVNTDDIVVLRKYIAGLLGESGINVEAADVDGKTGVTTDDLVIIRRIVVGLA